MRTAPDPLQILGGVCSSTLLSIFLYILAGDLGVLTYQAIFHPGSVLSSTYEIPIYFIYSFFICVGKPIALIYVPAHCILIVKHLRGESSWIILFLSTLILNAVSVWTAEEQINGTWIYCTAGIVILIAGGIYLKNFIRGLRQETGL